MLNNLRACARACTNLINSRPTRRRKHLLSVRPRCRRKYLGVFSGFLISSGSSFQFFTSHAFTANTVRFRPSITDYTRNTRTSKPNQTLLNLTKLNLTLFYQKKKKNRCNHRNIRITLFHRNPTSKLNILYVGM